MLQLSSFKQQHTRCMPASIHASQEQAHLWLYILITGNGFQCERLPTLNPPPWVMGG